ncbi:MAG: Nif3-like dinuclear metal center hexameric protein, partial [Candidatus Krumholzibacteriota bacterium]|nr:Nif3-like dinuclear metal center hexameric protein [Candidatus Krumholzibacteriota bacterium]
LYAAHLPLDCHPGIGNNALIADLLGLEGRATFGRYKGIEIGVLGALPRPVTPSSLAARVRRLTGAPVRTFSFGPSRIRRLGVVSGGGSMLLEAASAAGCDALLTGEPAHSAWHVAREARINLLCGGHYATETLGVRALGDRIAASFGLPVFFIDVPTGL